MDTPDSIETPLLATMCAAAGGASATHVGADLLDADMLLQRDAVLHAGCREGGRLSHGQRRVLHAGIASAEGEVVAAGEELGVAALAGWVASLLVDRAIADGRPPLVAVLAEDAARVPAEVAGLGFGRWLPMPEGLDGRELYLACSDGGWLAGARPAFLERASGYLGRDVRSSELHAVRMTLRGRLDRINSARMILTNVVAAGAEPKAVGLQLERLAELCALSDDDVATLQASATSLASVDVALDGVRAREAALATHLFECAWLEYAEGGALLDAEELRHPRYHDLDALWCQLSALRPVHVLPAQGAERAFRYVCGNDEDGVARGMLDLVGVVGAERMDAEAMLPAFSLAGRALVTGVAPAGEDSLLACAQRACRWTF